MMSQGHEWKILYIRWSDFFCRWTVRYYCVHCETEKVWRWISDEWVARRLGVGKLPHIDGRALWQDDIEDIQNGTFE